jgi:putative ABC transport system permease protein
MEYLNRADLGYDKSMVVIFPSNAEGKDADNLLKQFRAEIMKQPSVVDVTGYSKGIGDNWLFLISRRNGGFFFDTPDVNEPAPVNRAEEGDNYFFVNKVDRHFIPAMDIKIIEGRNFAEDHPSDKTNAIIVNQAMVKMQGWENPIGQKVRGIGDAAIIGVVEDFNYYSLRQKIEPLILHMFDFVFADNIDEIAVRIKAENIKSTLVMLEDTWSKISDGLPFNYSFLDERVAKQYIEDDRWRKIIRFASMTALLIACLGLFGLTSLAVAKRGREVGVRKVLGASVKSVVIMFSRDFIRLILISNLMALPFCYYVMQSWLEEFAYKTEIKIWLFIMAAAISLGVAILTIAFQTIKAALADPVKALRYE